MRLDSIYTYPVKGCYRVEQPNATVEPWGLQGDRRWLIVDAESGRFVSQREYAGLTQLRPRPVPGGIVFRTSGRVDLMVSEPVDAALLDISVWTFHGVAMSAGDDADAWLSDALNTKVRLVFLDDPRRRPVNPDYGQPGDTVSFADGYPVLLANTASLAQLNDWIAETGSPQWPLDMTRFRPNLVITDAPAWIEDGWIGGRIRVGEVTFRVPKPCGRCIVTTTDQETGERGREPLRTLARHRHEGQKLMFAVNLIPDAAGTVQLGDAITVL